MQSIALNQSINLKCLLALVTDVFAHSKRFLFSVTLSTQCPAQYQQPSINPRRLQYFNDIPALHPRAISHTSYLVAPSAVAPTAGSAVPANLGGRAERVLNYPHDH